MSDWDPWPVEHVCSQPPVVEGSATKLHRLWKVGDFVEWNEWHHIRRAEVMEVGWNQLWPGAQNLVLGDLEYPRGYSRHVGMNPFKLRPMGVGAPLEVLLQQAKLRHGAGLAAFHNIGHWRDQRSAEARIRWQHLKRASEGLWSEVNRLQERLKKEGVAPLPEPTGTDQLNALFAVTDEPKALGPALGAMPSRTLLHAEDTHDAGDEVELVEPAGMDDSHPDAGSPAADDHQAPAAGEPHGCAAGE